ncbi:MAG: hypothetical protein Q8K45_02150 [Rubrivivax sp.]|nr:hypothetical protein [Rubrivivax sp.]
MCVSDTSDGLLGGILFGMVLSVVEVIAWMTRNIQPSTAISEGFSLALRGSHLFRLLLLLLRQRPGPLETNGIGKRRLTHRLTQKGIVALNRLIRARAPSPLPNRWPRGCR